MAPTNRIESVAHYGSALLMRQVTVARRRRLNRPQIRASPPMGSDADFPCGFSESNGLHDMHRLTRADSVQQHSVFARRDADGRLELTRKGAVIGVAA